MDSNDPEEERPKYGQEENSMRLELLGLQLKTIRFFGVLSPENKTRKHKIFITISTVYILLYFPQMCGMMAAAYEYWGNIDMVIKILFQITTAIEAEILTSYFIIRGKKLALLLDMLEINFVPHIEKVVTPENKRRIIKKASRQSMIVTCVLVTIYSSIILGWVFLPLIWKYKDASAQGKPDDIWRYYCYIIWLPKEMFKPFMYGIVYLCQVLTVVVVVGHYTGCSAILFAFMFHTSTHFKLLASAFDDMRKVYEGETAEIGKQIHTPALLLISINSTARDYLIHDCGKTVLNSGKNTVCVEGDKSSLLNPNQYPEDIQSLQLLSADNMFRCQTTEYEASTQTSPTEEEMNLRFINCVKYHQALLE
jgi:hypothetical protein